MYYEDLSKYSYYKPVERTEKVRVYFDIAVSDEITLLNVGWLDDATIPFRQGTLDPRAIDQVATLCLTRQGMMRGFHVCRLCDETSLPCRGMMTEFHEGRQIAVGNGEVWFRGLPQRGAVNAVTVYIAPTMLLHYIKKHAYLPPDEAIEALLSPDYNGPGMKQG